VRKKTYLSVPIGGEAYPCVWAKKVGATISVCALSIGVRCGGASQSSFSASSYSISATML